MYGYCDGTSGYNLSIADFSNPDAPALASQLVIPSTGWRVAARFDTDRLYLSPQTYDYGTGATATPGFRGGYPPGGGERKASWPVVFHEKRGTNGIHRHGRRT